MPVIWRIEGGDIHPDGGNVNYFGKKAEAGRALREYRTASGDRTLGRGPVQVKLAGRDAIIDELQKAMASARGATIEEDEPEGLADLL